MNKEPCRLSLIEHPPESGVVLGLMSEAVDLLLARRMDDALERILQADIGSLREWFHYLAQRTTVVLRCHGIDRSSLPSPPKELKTPGDASAGTKHAVFRRDRWHCRFCVTRVIDPRVRKRLSDTFGAFPWGRGNLNKHACLAVLASHDHVLPRQWGGSNEPDNLVTACWPCQFSRHSYRIEDCGIFDPRDRPPVDSGWDGLLPRPRCRLRTGQRFGEHPPRSGRQESMPNQDRTPFRVRGCNRMVGVGHLTGGAPLRVPMQ